jgi:alpha-mannosidase
MTTLHFVSHTHWDREWYLTFQQFRLKLVHLVDNLLAILVSDPDYRHFMLDGQTIVLDDYLEMRPEKAEILKGYIQEGRILIGPWHILPDEFLVSPEATIRNLLQGDRTARQYGPKMMVGYTPDPFGHIGQMPQILSGFDIQVAAFRRGLSMEPCELWWQGPDGSRVLVSYLRDGYDNAAWLSFDKPEQFLDEVRRLRDSLAPHTTTGHLLLMGGTDHMEPPPETSAVLAYADQHLADDKLVHSTLPDYFEAIQASLGQGSESLMTITGELRSPRTHHLLPGVLSTRMWIKQRNAASQVLLEKWAEPFSTWAGLVAAGERRTATGETMPGYQRSERIADPAPILRQAWRSLMENHPHDSICGCSVDQVHEEMRVRFDQVDQIGEEITRQSLMALVADIDTRSILEATQPDESASPSGLGHSAIVVFNPTSWPRTDIVPVEFQLSAGVSDFEIVDQDGVTLPHSVLSTERRDLATLPLDRHGLMGMMGVIQTGEVGGMALLDLGFRRDGDTLVIDAVMLSRGETSKELLERRVREAQMHLADESLDSFLVHVHTPTIVQAQFIAPQVPGYGYRTFWIRPASPPVAEVDPGVEPVLENEYLRLAVDNTDGSLTVTYKRTGAIFSGLNRFIDGGDAGDEYNYSPPASDTLVSNSETAVESVRVINTPERQTVEISLTLPVPVSLSDDRQARSTETLLLKITTRASLYPQVPRMDFRTVVENPARDHRLRVHFPLPFQAMHADYDGHFEVIRRPVRIPEGGVDWVEQPRPEVPQRTFVDVTDGENGLMLANRGLPEVAVLPTEDGTSKIALTLLRCVGWLSRDDFSTRQGHAGPMIATPGAQELGVHTFEYSLIPHRGDWREAFRQAYGYSAPLRAVSADSHPGRMEAQGSFFLVEPQEFVLSAVKVAEDGSGWITRGYNLTSESLNVRLTPSVTSDRAVRLNLAERELEELPLDPDGGISFDVEGHQIVTIKWEGLS